jgi:hypothetical protein
MTHAQQAGDTIWRGKYGGKNKDTAEKEDMAGKPCSGKQDHTVPVCCVTYSEGWSGTATNPKYLFVI